MAEKRQSLEERVVWLETQVGELNSRLAELDARYESGGVGKIKAARQVAAADSGDASEEILSWVGRTALLPRISSLCFLLVVALALRTVTDNQLLDPQIGSLLGMVYAGGLIAWGAFKYRQASPLAPVFAVAGTLLMFSVVAETHAHFDALPTVPAYIILAIVGAAAALISYLNRVAAPVFAGTLGMSIAGLAIDYPNPVFPYLAILLLAANLFGVYATRLQRCSWLRWILLLLTLLVLQIWSFKLGIFLGRQEYSDLPFALSGFFPMLAIFVIFYLGTAIVGIIWRAQDRVARFDLALPTLSCGWLFVLGRYVVNAGNGSPQVLGIVATLLALALLGIAHWMGSRRDDKARGTNAFSLAAVVLLAMALPLALDHPLLALSLLSAIALGLTWVAQRWESGGVRVTSYLLQFYACGALVMELQGTEVATPSALSALAAGALACIGLWHFRWVRTHLPAAESLVFSRFDKEDRSAILLLLAALVSGFFTLRVGIYQAMRVFHLEGPGAFGCYQSVLINLSAIILMAMALWRDNRELRNVAILVTLVGGAKVFFGDLLGAKGVPLVLSVFSFGLAAAVDSIVLGRWQKSASGEQEPTAESQTVAEA
ncbi:hypothetical protein JCM30471_26260 [Desulfuromonas carbonis]|uniref:DUF2339 domain-containing protein n=1 Tax=Desulfuromonas sp. DDH964 TaxID=1823759 RepID=UPI00078DD930|nr:DUF2339 domain-containing protein [Desulfuromonas sp. DDH964]AMV70818.1 hypothetical protein DBW_0416 [Desulfuromonas sp. DDH964]